jgi:hypothetical protein
VHVHTLHALGVSVLNVAQGIQHGCTLGEHTHSGVAEGSEHSGRLGPGVAQVSGAWPVMTGETLHP